MGTGLKPKTSWAAADEYRDWFGAMVLSGRIDWPSIAGSRSFTLVSDEHGVTLPTKDRATT